MKLSRLLAVAAAAVLATCTPAAALAAAGVTADVTAGLQGDYTGANALGSVSAHYNVQALNRFSPGVAANQADKVFSDTRTLTASATENQDLAGVLADPFGVTLTFVKVKAIFVHAAAANTNNVCFGGAASNGFLGPFSDATDIICVKPGGVAVVTAPAAGWPVTASTGDILKFANSGSGTSVTWDEVIVGTSA